MTKSDVKNALDKMREMTNEEISSNAEFVRKVAEAAYALIKSLERK